MKQPTLLALLFLAMCWTNIIWSQTKIAIQQIDQLIKNAIELREAHDYQSALEIAEQAKKLAEEKTYVKGLGDALVQMGRCCKATFEYDLAIDCYKEALTARKSINDYCGVAGVYTNLSSIVEDLDEALIFAKRAIFSGEKKTCDGLFAYYNNLAKVYAEMGQIEMAISTNRVSLKWFPQLRDTVERIKISYELASNYHNLGERENALIEADSAFYFLSQITLYDSLLIGQMHEMRGVIRMAAEQNEGALEDFERAKKIYDKFPQAKAHQANINFNMGVLYEHQGDRKKAQKAYEECLAYADEDSDLYRAVEALVQLMITEQEKKQRARWLSYALAGLLALAIAAIILVLLVLKKERKNELLRAEASQLKHDIVKNDLQAIDNHLSIALDQTSNTLSIYKKILQLRGNIRKLLTKIGYPEYGEFGPKHLKAFVKEMHAKACEVALMEVDNHSYLDEVDDVELSKNLRTQLEAIITELFTNIRKYAQCQQATIEFSVNDNGLHIEIEDDGQGYDHLKVKANGLKHIQARLKNIKGRFKIHTSPGNGTRTKITIPEFPENHSNP